MSKKKYTPQAGDVCEYKGATGNKYELLVCSPIIIDPFIPFVIAYDKIDFERSNCESFWRCDINDLKLIYRP